MFPSAACDPCSLHEGTSSVLRFASLEYQRPVLAETPHGCPYGTNQSRLGGPGRRRIPELRGPGGWGRAGWVHTWWVRKEPAVLQWRPPPQAVSGHLPALTGVRSQAPAGQGRDGEADGLAQGRAQPGVQGAPTYNLGPAGRKVAAHSDHRLPL